MNIPGDGKCDSHQIWVQALDEGIWGVVEEIRRTLGEAPSPALPRKGEGAGKTKNRALGRCS